jgi:hypothetical protein
MKVLRVSKKGDWYFVLMIGIITIGSWLWISLYGASKQSLVAEISCNGQVLQKINLNAVNGSKYINLNEGIKLTVLAEKGRIKVLEADCPDKICVQTGWLTRPGDMAVCVPSRTIVMIKALD